MDAKDPHIRSQNSAHRRGLVLGLTMAEVMVLILFALLLALGATLAAKNATISARDERIEGLTALEEQIQEILRSGAPGIAITDIIQRLERQQKEIVNLRKEIERLQSYEAAGKALNDIIRVIKREGGDDVTPQSIVEQLQNIAQLNRENETLRGQLDQLSKTIKATGKGNEFPSCWVTPPPDSRPESIFELTVTSSGIIIKQRPSQARASEKAQLPISGLRYDVELPLSDFLNDLRPLYQWSVDHKCRFYIIRYTAVRDAPYDSVNAMDGYFYPDSKLQFRAIAR